MPFDVFHLYGNLPFKYNRTDCPDSYQLSAHCFSSVFSYLSNAPLDYLLVSDTGYMTRRHIYTEGYILIADIQLPDLIAF